MSHNVNYSVYPENVNKNGVQAEWDSVAAHEDYQEGCSGLPGSIKWKPNIAESEEEAEKLIESMDSGWYDQLAVRFKKYPEPKTTKKLAALTERKLKLQRKANEMEWEPHFKNVKSKFIACKRCGSKISSEYMKGNRCPVCSADMRPQTTLDAIKRAQQVAKEAAKEEEKAIKAASMKNGKCKLCWLVKTEYHT